MHVLKHTGNAAHPFTRFSAGNRRTLGEVPREAGVDIVAAVRQFYETCVAQAPAARVCEQCRGSAGACERGQRRRAE